MAPLLNEEQFGIVLSTMAQRGTSIATDSNQHEMLAALLRGQNQIELVCGQAGSGKTAGMTGLSVALEGGYLGETSPVHDDGIPRLRVVGCTLAANAAKNLQEQSGVTSFSITMLTHRLATGDVVLEAGALVIVDECSQASTAQLAQLWAHVERAGGRLVLMGDERQLQSVMAGGLYTTMLDSVPEATVTLDETRRQNNLEERAILATIHDRGRLREQSVKALAGQGVDPALIARLRARALDEVKDWYKENSRIVIHSSPAHAVAAIATSYWDAVEASGGDPAGAALVMARSNDEIRLLDRAIVEEAVLRQHLDPDAVVEFGRRSLLRGQRVVTRKVDRVLDVLNGQVGVVEGVELVTSKWTVELSSPSVYTTRRVFNRAAAAGETIPVAMSPRQVAREQAKATTHLHRRTELVDQARGRLLEAGESLRPAQKARLEAMAAQREDELAAAQAWHEWAQSLPSSGGQVSMTVASAMPKNEEERLVVRLDDDTRRFLPAAFVARHLDSGYAATTQRSQGQTVDEGLQYGQLSYVGLSRGRVRNVAHLVVAPPDPTTVERENEALAATRQWLARIIGEPETDQLMAAATARLRSGQPSPTEVIADQLAVTIQANADSQRTAIAEQVAQAHRLGERVLAVAKSREMAGDLSDAVVAHLVATGKGTVLSAPINGRSWVRGMPVVLARGEVSGLVHGATYYVVSVAKSGLFLDSDEDQRVQLSAAQVRDHLDPAFAVTAARAQQSIAGADRIVAVANGLSDEDLAWVSEQTTPVDVVLTDPEVAGEIAYQRACDAKITELLRRDCGAGWQSRSAHAMIDSQEQEIGLASLQAEIRLTAAACDEVRTSSPRDVARRDLEQEMIELRQRRAELELRSRTAADDDDQIDARWGIERLEAELAQLQLRYQVVTGELADDDPAVTRELAVSAARHGFDDARLVEAERRLVRYTQERVTSALKNPRPYHREISVDPSLDAAAAQAERLGLLIQIEQYRLRWAIDDLTSALGAEPSGGLQLDEWTKVVQRLGDGDRAWDARAR
jgi:hypothetical protein